MRLAVFLLFGIVVSLSAGPSVTDAKSKLVSDVQVQSWLKNWQNRLHLEDWTVSVRIVRSTELKPDTLGNLKWDSQAHTAAIKILSPLDYELSAADTSEDMEYTIVHELVHLQLSVLPRDLKKKDVEEEVVNKISDALMGLDKGPAFHARSVPVQKPSAKPSEPEVAGRAGPRQ